MYGQIKNHLQTELSDVESAGLFKKERIITTPQGADVSVSSGEEVVIMCANNYLGLSSHPDVVQASKNVWIRTDLGCPLFDLFAELKIFIKS